MSDSRRRLARHAGADGEGSHPKEDTGIGDIVVGVERDADPRLVQDLAIDRILVAGLQFPARRIEQNHGTGDVGGCNLVGHPPCFADVVQYHGEVKFVGQSQDGDDIVVAMRMMMHDPLALHGFHQ